MKSEIEFGVERRRDPMGRLLTTKHGVTVHTRFSGECAIFVFQTEWTAGEGKLEVLIIAPGEDAYGVTVGLSQEQMWKPLWAEKLEYGDTLDSVAHAALSFSDSDGYSLIERAALNKDGSGWHIGRHLDQAWPRKVRDDDE